MNARDNSSPSLGLLLESRLVTFSSNGVYTEIRTVRNRHVSDGVINGERQGALRREWDRRFWDCWWHTMPGETGGCTAVMDDFGALVKVAGPGGTP